MDIFSKKWHFRHARNIRKRKATSKERLKARKQRANKIQKQIEVPVVLDFFEKYNETVEFIENIKKCVFQDKANVFLNFSKCEKISSEACVVLAAEIERCRKKALVSGSYPNNDEVYFLLNEIGFFRMLQIRSSKRVLDDNSEVDVIKLQSGKKGNPQNIMKGIKGLFYTEDGEQPNTPFERRVYGALTEAMSNAVEHAYPQDFTEKNSATCVPYWWRAGFRDNRDNIVLIVLYDQGAGIPNTLHINLKENLKELAAKLKRTPYDDEKIALAMGKGRSRTKIEGRGFGTYDMQSVIKESLGGFLSVFSYNGKYTYHSSDNIEQERLRGCLSGTLVVWQLSLDKTE